MPSTPEISVVMPVFNDRKFLPEAVESILTQSFEDFEFVVVDDGSSDGCGGLIREFANRDARIKPVFRSHAGIVETLNTGLARAAGKYIARMDADDISPSDRLRLQYDFMEEHRADLCGGHYIVIDGEGRYLFTHVVSTRPELTPVLLARTTPFAHGSAMIRRSFIEEHQIVYRNIDRAEDYGFWIDCYEHGAKIMNLNAFIYLHRKSAKQHSRIRRKDSQLVSKAFIKRRHDEIFGKIRTFCETGAEFCQYERHSAANFLIRSLFWGQTVKKAKILLSLGRLTVLLNLLHYLRLL